MKTKAFIWVMVTLLGVAMTTAGSCDSSGSDSSDTLGGDTTATDTTTNIKDETNKVDKLTIEAFKKYNDRLIQGINSYTEEKYTIIAYAGYILNELPRYEEAIKKIGDQGDQTGSQSLSSIEAKDFVQLAQAVEGPAKDIQAWNNNVLNYLNKGESKENATTSANSIIDKLPTYKFYLEKINNLSDTKAQATEGSGTDDSTEGSNANSEQEHKDYINKSLHELRTELASDIKMLAFAFSVGCILLVASLIATIVYFRTKLKKVSQKLGTADPAGQEKAGKETLTGDGNMQKEINGLRQRLTNVENNVKRNSAILGDLEYKLNRLSSQPIPQAPPVNNGYAQGGGMYGNQLNGGNTVPTPPVVPADGTRLYAELDAASNGGLLYKAQPTRTANSLYEITLTQPGATGGSFRVLEDCTILANVLRNRNSYLAACTFNGNDNATKIVNEAPGAVSKQQDGTWLVTKKAKIKLS